MNMAQFFTIEQLRRARQDASWLDCLMGERSQKDFENCLSRIRMHKMANTPM